MKTILLDKLLDLPSYFVADGTAHIGFVFILTYKSKKFATCSWEVDNEDTSSLVKLMTSLVRWVLYFRYSASLKMRNIGVMFNYFLRKFQEPLESRYNGLTFCLSVLSMSFTYVLGCETNFVLLILIKSLILHLMGCRHCSYVCVWEIQKLNKHLNTSASRGRTLSL